MVYTCTLDGQYKYNVQVGSHFGPIVLFHFLRNWHAEPAPAFPKRILHPHEVSAMSNPKYGNQKVKNIITFSFRKRANY